MRAKYIDCEVSQQTVKALFQYIYGDKIFALSPYCVSECPRMCAECIEIAKKTAGLPEPDIHGKNDSICWCCKHATGTCTWSSEYENVEGSVVIRTRTGTRIKECPMFERGVINADYD